jgi:hypothetical protein
VDQQVLRPILHVLGLGKAVGMLPHPVANVLGEPFVELVEALRDDESILAHVSILVNRERLGFPVFNRKVVKSDGLILDSCGIALPGETPFERN